MYLENIDYNYVALFLHLSDFILMQFHNFRLLVIDHSDTMQQ